MILYVQQILIKLCANVRIGMLSTCLDEFCFEHLQ